VNPAAADTCGVSVAEETRTQHKECGAVWYACNLAVVTASALVTILRAQQKQLGMMYVIQRI